MRCQICILFPFLFLLIGIVVSHNLCNCFCRIGCPTFAFEVGDFGIKRSRGRYSYIGSAADKNSARPFSLNPLKCPPCYGQLLNHCRVEQLTTARAFIPFRQHFVGQLWYYGVLDARAVARNARAQNLTLQQSRECH